MKRREEEKKYPSQGENEGWKRKKEGKMGWAAKKRREEVQDKEREKFWARTDRRQGASSQANSGPDPPEGKSPANECTETRRHSQGSSRCWMDLNKGTRRTINPEISLLASARVRISVIFILGIILVTSQGRLAVRAVIPQTVPVRIIQGRVMKIPDLLVPVLVSTMRLL